MKEGKETCKYLKELRRNIAKENGIDFDMPDCQFQGPCIGTCPRCEYEIKELERRLSHKLSLGKAASVAGIALSLASPALAAESIKQDVAVPEYGLLAKQVFSNVGLLSPDTNYAFRILVKDDSNEVCPFANILVMKDNVIVGGARTNFDGIAIIEGLPMDEYDIQITFVGFESVLLNGCRPVEYSKNKMDEIEVNLHAVYFFPPMMGILIREAICPIGPDSQTETEIDGVKVKVQY